MRTMLDMVSDSINCDDPALFKSVAVKAYERKMLDIAELFAEKVLDIIILNAWKNVKKR